VYHVRTTPSTIKKPKGGGARGRPALKNEGKRGRQAARLKHLAGEGQMGRTASREKRKLEKQYMR